MLLVSQDDAPHDVPFGPANLETNRWCSPVASSTITLPPQVEPRGLTGLVAEPAMAAASRDAGGARSSSAQVAPTQPGLHLQPPPPPEGCPLRLQSSAVRTAAAQKPMRAVSQSQNEEKFRDETAAFVDYSPLLEAGAVSRPASSASASVVLRCGLTCLAHTAAIFS